MQFDRGRLLLWALLIAPLAVLSWRYLSDSVYYGEYLHWTGVQAVRLLIVTLAVTPFAKLVPRAAAIRWFKQRRRDLGLITFAYALAHIVAYIAYKADASTILGEGLEAGMLAGWLALPIFLALAMTSNDASVRKLGRRWQTLHRLVWVAALLTLAHWVLTAFDPAAGYWHAAVLAVLLVMRRLPRRAA